MKTMAERARSLLIAFVLAVVCTGSAMAHPYHVAFLEAEVNPESQRLEVAMRVFPEDLEAALERMRGEGRVRLERTEDVDALISEFLARTILLRDPTLEPDDDGETDAPTRSTIHWLGKELGVRHTWLYFEIELGRDDAEGLEISVRSMFDVEPTQENAIRFRKGDERVTLRCTRATPWALIDFTPAPPDEPGADQPAPSR